MALPPLTQPTFLGDRDPMIRDPFAPSTIEPGYIRDSDLGSAFVRYPKAGGRLVQQGIGALMDDPLGLLTGAATGAYDFIRESGDPATFVQDLGMSLGLPIVESGQRLSTGEYPGMSLEEEEEARLLDALTVAELIPMVGLGIKGVTGAMRRRLRAENPDMDDAEIEAIMAQMEGPGDPGGADLGPRPDELSLEEFEAANIPMAGEIAGDMERFAPGFTRQFAESLSNVGLSSDEIFDRVNTALVERGYNLDERRQLLTDVFPDDAERLAGLTDLPMDPIEIEMINASRVEDGLPPLPGEQIIAQEYDEIFNADPFVPTIQTAEQRLSEQFDRYFSGVDDGYDSPFDEIERIGLDLQGLGYSDADIADAFDNALSRYTPEQRRQFRTDAAAFADAEDYDPVIAGDEDGFNPMAGDVDVVRAVRDAESDIEDRLNYQLGRYFGDVDQMTISDSLVGIGEDVVGGLDDLGYGAAETFTFIDEAMERGGYTPDQRRQLMDELFPPVATEPGQPLDPWRAVQEADDVLQIPEGGAPPGLQALANAVQENMANDPLDPFGPPPGASPTPMNQLEAMDFNMTGQDTALNSRLDEVLAQGGQTKFANLDQLRNYLMNPKNRVSNAELEARGITEANFGNSKIDLNNPDTQELLARTPLKVRILDGADVQYKNYFLNNPTDYRETVITLGNTPFDGPQSGVGDSGHFAATQYSMGGPSLVHMRTGQFDVIDPPTTEKPATIAGKTFHVGEIQSEATQDATKVRKSRRFMEAVGGGDFDVADERLQEPFLQIARLKAQKRLEEDRLALQAAGQKFSSSDLARLKEARKGFNYRDDGGAGIDAEIKAILEANDLPETFYEDTLKGMVNSKLFDEDVTAFLDQLIEGDTLNSPGEVANRLGYFGDEVSRIALDTSPDDVGLGSLYQTDRITNIAVKQALEQAIASGADFITFNRSDLVKGMTGGDLKGHQAYYDNILPKNVNKLMERLEKEHNVKLPRLEKLQLKTESGPELGKVNGFALTPELKELFKGTGISAYREGGQVKMRSGVMALPGNGVVR